MSDEKPYDCDAILEAQEKFFSDLGTRPLSFRLESLARLASALEKNQEQIQDALRSDLGKPPLESYLSEIYFVATEIRYFLKYLKRWTRPQRVGNPFYFFPARSEIRYEPFGTSLIVAPWNYPFQLSISPLIASIAAGNCVMLKPSEAAPATAELLRKMIASVFDPAHVTVVTGGAEIGESLLKLPFKHWFYTGSETVGRLYGLAAARHLAPCVLELGGKSPCVIDSNIDLDQTVERIATAKFFNAGQTCIAPDFVLVPEALHDAFVEKMEHELRLRYSDSSTPEMSNIANESHFARLQRLISDEAVQVGVDDPETHFLAPRILPRTNWEDACMKEEIFGPVLPVVPYRNIGEAISKLKERPSPLALYVFSRENDFLERIAAEVQSGSVCFNDAIKQATVLELPFGGVGASGMGRYRGRAGFETFSYSRAVTKRYFFKDFFAVKPPYGNRLESMKRLLK